jgi:hypothetical protein
VARAPNLAKVRGQPPNTHSEIGLAAVIRNTARLWRPATIRALLTHMTEARAGEGADFAGEIRHG